MPVLEYLCIQVDMPYGNRYTVVCVDLVCELRKPVQFGSRVLRRWPAQSVRAVRACMCGRRILCVRSVVGVRFAHDCKRWYDIKSVAVSVHV